MAWTSASGTPSCAASPACTKCDFCEPVQHLTLPSLISITAQAGPMQACDWNGHSYSASITLAAVLNASSTLPAVFPSTACLRTGALRMWSYNVFWLGNGGSTFDHSTLSVSAALIASHSLGA